MLAFLKLFLKFYLADTVTTFLSVFLSRIQEVYSFLPASTVIHYYKILESKKQVDEIILLRYSVFRV